MTSIPPSLERSGNIHGNEQHSAHYALAALRAEVGQLSAKAFCTAAATEAAQTAQLKRLRDLVVLQAAAVGADRQSAHLDREIAFVCGLIKEAEQKIPKSEDCVAQTLQVFKQLTSTVESQAKCLLRRFGIRV